MAARQTISALPVEAKVQKVWTLLIRTAKGLEASLHKELMGFSLPGVIKFPSLRSGYVEIQQARAETMWLVALQSRIAENVYIRMGDSFFAKTEKNLVQYIETLPWDAVIPFAAMMEAPSPIQISIENSQLASEKLIRKRLLEAIDEKRMQTLHEKGDTLLDIYQRRGSWF
ncbi:Rna methylase family UPF0020 protein [Cardiosporidium cionae]|uniref:Rna methylase family UPF0020 protein n=1 Tax=Cardiosporidium cionae TaxID=476202 RepID=A0ABQ7JG34_9APIC|nr:Rna methylase family UPF0020 protein [Cardiosporidium cionae]|eukprot:KAF8822995.1 Rna methylase family UPF0020 protein [Cardiosporidium cionae]